jgi:hypothetical protein
MFPDEDDGPGPETEAWDEYGVRVDHEPFRAAEAALSLLVPLSAAGARSVAGTTGIKAETVAARAGLQVKAIKVR